MGSKATAIFLICMVSMLVALPPAYAWGNCPPPYPPYHRPSPRRHPPSTPRPHPPHHGGAPPKTKPPSTKPPIIVPPVILPPPVVTPPVVNPPVIIPPIINPPVISPPIIDPPSSSPYPPYTSPPSPGCGVPGISPPPTIRPTCPINGLKLGLCLDVLGGLVHIRIGNPVENVCCPVLQGLLELEAAACLCTTIRLKLLNLNIFLPLALQALVTCGLTPPPGFVCPPLL